MTPRSLAGGGGAARSVSTVWIVWLQWPAVLAWLDTRAGSVGRAIYAGPLRHPGAPSKGGALSLTGKPSSPTTGKRFATVDGPWRPTSILYPSFFGGPLAAAVLGMLNGRRLSLPRRTLVVVGLSGVACMLVRFLLTSALHEHGLTPILGSLTGAAVWVTVLVTQRRPFQEHEQQDGATGSLVRPGIAAAVGCGLLEAMLLGLAVP